MKKSLLLLLLVAGQQLLWAQLYLDVAAVRYQHSSPGGLFMQGFSPNKYTYASVGLNVPVVFKDSSVLMLSPAMEAWNISSPALPQLPHQLYGLAIPVAFVKKLSTVWTATCIAIPRWNGAKQSHVNNRFQLGGAVLLAKKQNETFTYKFGVYYNREAFGHFIMPLLGVDWRPTPTWRVFGVLPGNAVVEKKVSRTFYYGFSFRATTTSYGIPAADIAPHFIRIEDNTVQAFADVYVTKNLVLNAEVGHSAFRRFRMGRENDREKYFVNEKFNDGPLFRLSLLYRVRFDGGK